ncbi:AbrB/MazE/SpoVT family DNA-binding domain-containing protein [Lentisphaera marina]|uniref:AbrB/MazE/SpoVT family DNA-binding domain-containing protein n=1 Tax=Lentisphaera marina TaxID=1111041 RepID=UPI00236715AC|nr:AbrB/MazE/SpoVT family DNA-binding domain-containing protein [Lentisphaera marina]MDD7985537.1 AbrB/MazE/SpoVT family DNA-binding domain-containing protein [Lentisphaera marina]
MTTSLKLRKVGNSTGMVFPKEFLQRLRVENGDELFLIETQNGIELSPYDPDFGQEMDLADQIMKKRRNVLKKLGE